MIQSSAIRPSDSEHRRRSESENVVEISNLTRKFGSKIALDNVTLNIPQGVVIGLVGLNGAGKTTLIKHILGLYRAQSGTVSVFGRDPSRNPEKSLVQVGCLTEEDTLPGWMKVWQIHRFASAFYPGWDHDYANELIDTFKLEANKRIKQMSKGQRARVGLTLALAHRPKLLVLDEPSSGLDPVVRNDILGAIIRTIADQGNTVLFSSHLLDEVQRLSDTVGVIREGKLVEFGALDEMQTKYQRVRVRTKDTNSPPDLSPLGEWSRHGDEWTAILDVREEELDSTFAFLDAEIVRSESVSLNEWFVDSSRTS